MAWYERASFILGVTSVMHLPIAVPVDMSVKVVDTAIWAVFCIKIKAPGRVIAAVYCVPHCATAMLYCIDTLPGQDVHLYRK